MIVCVTVVHLLSPTLLAISLPLRSAAIVYISSSRFPLSSATVFHPLWPRSALMYNIYLYKILKYIIYMIVYCTARRSQVHIYYIIKN